MVDFIKVCVKENRLLFAIICGVILGFVIGGASHKAVHSLTTNPSAREVAMYIKFPGELFLRMLRLITIPLIVSSIVVALTEIDIFSVGRIGKITTVYYLSTSIFSSIVGIVLTLIIKPGQSMSDVTESKNNKESGTKTVDVILDLLRNAFPGNIFEAMFRLDSTKYGETTVNYQIETKNVSQLANMSIKDMAEFLKSNIIVPATLGNSTNEGEVHVITNDVIYEFNGLMKNDGTNMIGLIVFSIILGIVLNYLKEDGKILVDVFKCIWNVMMKMVEIIMWISPVGIASIVAGNLLETKNISSMFEATGFLFLTTLVGYLIIAVFFYQIIYLIVLRRSPISHIKSILPALVTAFGTESSAATLPTTIRCCEEQANLNTKVTRFVLPIGATLNMDGVALYYAIVVVFTDQVQPDVTLNVGELIVTVLMSTMISIGAAGIPNGGIANLIIALETVGLPITKLGPIFALIGISFVTAINVMGDTYTAVVVAKLCGDEIKEHAVHGDANNEDKVNKSFMT